MMFARMLSSLAVATSLITFAAAPTEAQSTAPDTMHYALVNPPSQFEWGCYGPCACPVSIRSPLTGSFVLRRSHVDPLYTYYDVLNVRWKVPGSPEPVMITGSGTYRVGGEVALMEELTLDLSFDGGQVQRFTSGLRSPGAPFPEIDTRISLHEEYCFDSVLAVKARPRDVAGVGDQSRVPSLTLAPNPFTSVTQITFVLPRDGVVDLGVFDLAGRRVSAIVERQWLASGTHHRAWDGRKESRVAAPPGIYLVRMDTPDGVTAHTLVKLD